MTSKILTPTEWERLRNNLNPYYQIVCDAMLHTGLRPDSEFWRFVENPHWHLSGIIHVPHVPGIHQERHVCLSKEGREAVDALIALMKHGNGRKERNTVRDALRRAAIGSGKRPHIMEPDGINAGMFRRTLVAWLIACYPEKRYEILVSNGMDEETMKGYIGTVFPRKELTKIRKHLEGWTCKQIMEEKS